MDLYDFRVTLLGCVVDREPPVFGGLLGALVVGGQEDLYDFRVTLLGCEVDREPPVVARGLSKTDTICTASRRPCAGSLNGDGGMRCIRSGGAPTGGDGGVALPSTMPCRHLLCFQLLRGALQRATLYETGL